MIKSFHASIQQSCLNLSCFALLHHFHSCKAYDFVRKEFKTILSHPKTWSKQYTKTDASPGFAEESLGMLMIKCKNTDHSMHYALVFNEIIQIIQYLYIDHRVIIILLHYSMLLI